jgi:hypothetical protein
MSATTQDERAQDALAELGLGDEQRSQSRRRNDDGLHVTDRSCVDHAQVRSSGELPDVGNDLARDDLRHLLERCPDQLRERGHWHGLAQRIAWHDRDPAGQDHVHPGNGLSRVEEELPAGESPDLPETSDVVDLGLGKDRKHLVESRPQGGIGCGRPCRSPVPRCLVPAALVVDRHVSSHRRCADPTSRDLETRYAREAPQSRAGRSITLVEKNEAAQEYREFCAG